VLLIPTDECNLWTTDAGDAAYPKIEDITIDATYVKLTLEEFQNNSAGTSVVATSNNFIVFSAACDTRRVEVDDNNCTNPR
jgi:hypothetical protein